MFAYSIIQQVDNRVDGKFLAIKVSNHNIRIQFLYKSKLWSIEQEVLWQSEWSMFTLTWAEFEGLAVYVNNKLINYQQNFEYYSPQTSQKMTMFEEELTENELVKRNLQPGTIFVGFNNEVPEHARAFFWNFNNEAVDGGEQESPLSEAILLDELDIKNFRSQTKDIFENYLRSKFYLWF